ncbi:HAD family hydrolase [Bacteroides acidifaciens]|uniref:HAD family hydrolase n=2 Tax=Bacteroides acidifaciens TaxID=85831 RepID=UPI0025AEBE1E|nr:HAD family hydrolase [Bacteroides acidifaciens]
MMRFSSDKDIVVFDLDDTLYKEIDYLLSAYHAIADAVHLDVTDEMLDWYNAGKNAFLCLLGKYDVGLSLAELLEIYRYHEPKISLTPDSDALLSHLRWKNIKVGIISDGRSKTQRNKLKALGLEWIEDVVISEEFGSEKPCEANYLYFEKKYPGYRFTYIADNLKKDFVTPNRLGWYTICLKDYGRNIHSQNIETTEAQRPQITVENLTDLI